MRKYGKQPAFTALSVPTLWKVQGPVEHRCLGHTDMISIRFLLL